MKNEMPKIKSYDVNGKKVDLVANKSNRYYSVYVDGVIYKENVTYQTARNIANFEIK